MGYFPNFPWISWGDAVHATLPESTNPPYTVYVDHNLGNDGNRGNGPGAAVATLEKAASLLNIALHGGAIHFVGKGDGAVLVNSPVHLNWGIALKGITPEAVTLVRNFGTPNSRSVWDAITTVAGNTVQSASAAFAIGDVGRIVSIYGAGVGGGTYYDFISAVPDGTHATLTATTAIARNASTDPKGVKLSVVGDWNRVVTDAGMVAGTSVVTSLTAAFTTADVGTSLVIAGAGQGHQALRSVITAVAGNTATVRGVASFTVVNQRCTVGVNFGDLLTFHGGGGGMIDNIILDDESIGQNRIGAALKLISDDTGVGTQPGPADFDHRHMRITNSDPAGAWEHDIDIDGSWNQAGGGPGVRRTDFVACMMFGSRRPGETIRINGAVHAYFLGGGIVGEAPTTIRQGAILLDPQKTAGVQYGTVDCHFAGVEMQGDFYVEGQYCTYHGGRAGSRNNRPVHAVHLGPTADHCSVSTVNGSSGTADEYDEGTNNTISTQNIRPRSPEQIATLPGGVSFSSIPNRAWTNASQAIGASGVLVEQSLWLPGGKLISKVGILGGGTFLTWGAAWVNPHFMYGLYDPDGNLIAQTADTGGTQVFDNGLNDNYLNLVTPARVPRSGLCFIGLLINSGTGGSGFVYPTFAGLSNLLEAFGPALTGTTGAGLTALPNNIVTPLAAGANSLLLGVAG